MNLPVAVIALTLASGVTRSSPSSRETPSPTPLSRQAVGTTTSPATTQPTSAPAVPTWFPKHPGPWNAALYLARSTDGQTFKTSNKPIIRFAAAPTLVRLRDGHLLAVFEHYPRTDQRRFGGLAVAISKDNGKTWTDPKPLNIRGLSRRAGRPRGPALAVRPDGRLRLVFVCEDRRGRRAVSCAESSGDPAFRMRGRLKLSGGLVAVDDLVVLYVDAKCHLFGTRRGKSGIRYHALGTSGRRFDRLDDVPTAESGTQGCALAIDGGYRFYATSPVGILSATSADAESWKRDTGLRVPGGADPAVVRLGDGSFLMLYIEPSPSTHLRRRDTNIEGDQFTESDANVIEETAGQTVGEVVEVPEDDWWFESDDVLAAEDTADDAWADEDETAETDDTAAEPFAGDVAGEFTDDYDHEYTDTGVPIPDFQRPVDYRQWFQDRHDLDSVADNAYDHYADFLLDANGRPHDMEDLPDFQCMLNDAGFTGPPAPWDPEDHPEWEDSYHATAELSALYAEAATHRDYVRPLILGSFNDDGSLTPDGSGKDGDEQLNNLMIGMLLPDLSGHRRMVKQAISRAWRAEDGQADPDALIDAFDTSLSSAAHIVQGDTLIEMLVGFAERNLVEEHARWALEHDVFSAEEIEATLDLLADRDESLPPASQWMTGELAMSLDMTQYLFGPIEGGREPRLNPQRVGQLNKLFGGPGDHMEAPTPDEIAATAVDGVIDNFIEYNRRFTEMVERGYPEVRAADIDEMTSPYVKDNYVSRILMPSLSRAYQLSVRHEASRRATQLTYAIHLHKRQTGDWPATLDDLPRHYADAVRTDPFSGGDFAYCLTADGFTLYSASENGIDDGGVHDRRWGDKNKNDPDASDDYVFWPPTKRR